MFTELLNHIYGTVDGLPVIAIGAFSSTDQVGSTSETRLEWIVVDDDGMVRSVAYGALVVDVRFREGRWHDTAPGSADDEEA